MLRYIKKQFVLFSLSSVVICFIMQNGFRNIPTHSGTQLKPDRLYQY